MGTVIKNIINSKWLQHLVFWVLSIYAIASYFSISSLFSFIDVIYALIFHIPLMLMVYLNLNILIPRLFIKRKYLLYAFFAIINLGFAYAVHELVFEIMLPMVPSIYMVSFADWEVLVQIFGIYLVFTTLIKLSRSWYTLQHVEKENLSLELNSLKSQVNPHFFFNSLNSIYSLALKKDDRTPKVILELSQLMRYMLYEVGEEKVALEKELELMKTYIDLQRLRADDSTQIDFKIEGDVEGKMIAPLLFFPLIENSFKHGVKGTSNEGFVNIMLQLKGQYLTLGISNNKGETDDIEDGKFGGIGIENVKKRLKLIYPKSELIIDDTAESFNVKVNIEL
jgi:sensor histidine kinase YesM